MGCCLRLPVMMSSFQRERLSGLQWHGLKETQGPAHVCAIGGRLKPVVICTMSEHFNWVSLGPRDSTSQNFPKGNSWTRTPRFFAGLFIIADKLEAT